MSIAIANQIWHNAPDLRGLDLLVLLALPDWANQDAECWPSIPSLARKARVSERTAQVTVNHLVELGYLTVTRGGGRGRCSVYTIHPTGSRTPPDPPGPQHKQERPAASQAAAETSQQVQVFRPETVHDAHPLPQTPHEPRPFPPQSPHDMHLSANNPQTPHPYSAENPHASHRFDNNPQPAHPLSQTPQNTHPLQPQKGAESGEKRCSVAQEKVQQPGTATHASVIKPSIKEPLRIESSGRPNSLSFHSEENGNRQNRQNRQNRYKDDPIPSALEIPVPIARPPANIPFSNYIALVVVDFSYEFGDERHKTENVHQALRLWQKSGLDERAFGALLHEARRRMRKHQLRPPGEMMRNKMAYFFTVVCDLVKEARPVSPPEVRP